MADAVPSGRVSVRSWLVLTVASTAGYAAGWTITGLGASVGLAVPVAVLLAQAVDALGRRGLAAAGGPPTR